MNDTSREELLGQVVPEELQAIDKEKMAIDRLTEEMAKQNNRATAYPVYYVGEMSKRGKFTPDMGVGGFLTEEAAQYYLRSNSYHYKNGIVWTGSLTGNYQMRELIHILFRLVGKKYPMPYL